MYIRSRNIDSLFIIGAPLLAFLFIAMVSEPRFVSGQFLANPKTSQWMIILVSLMTQSHIMLVFLRSHGNSDVFRRYKFRFIVIPLLIIGAMWLNPVFFGIMGFVALYWDEWHSLMQTFGFGRIYDVKLGNNPETGRKLDMGMCFVLGLLPHILLLTFIPEEIRTSGLEFAFDLDRDVAEKYGHYIHAFQEPLIILGLAYIGYYIFRYRQLMKEGYKFSPNKLWLFASTGLSAILISSLYSVQEGAFFGNIYHALQYYFIIYVSEVPVITKKIKSSERNKILIIMAIAMIILGIALSLAYARRLTEGVGFMGVIWLTTSLMHFWYDGFIWSVRKNDI
ncbi:MAG: hypothetical protein V4598_05995 [Bdellovibrionota bacterium]